MAVWKENKVVGIVGGIIIVICIIYIAKALIDMQANKAEATQQIKIEQQEIEKQMARGRVR